MPFLEGLQIKTGQGTQKGRLAQNRVDYGFSCCSFLVFIFVELCIWRYFYCSLFCFNSPVLSKELWAFKNYGFSFSDLHNEILDLELLIFAGTLNLELLIFGCDFVF